MIRTVLARFLMRSPSAMPKEGDRKFKNGDQVCVDLAPSLLWEVRGYHMSTTGPVYDLENHDRQWLGVPERLLIPAPASARRNDN